MHTPQYGQTPPRLSQFTASATGGAGAGGRRRTWLKPALVGLALAVVLAAGGWAVWSFTGGPASGGSKGGGTGGKPAAGSVVWTAESRTKPDEKSMRSALGTWFTDSLVVKAEPDMVTAYDIRTGEKKWSFLLAGSLCAASRESDGGTAVVSVEYEGVCARLMAFDLRDGKRKWEELLVDDKDEAEALKPDKWLKAALELAVHDGHLYATWGAGEQTRRLSDGKRVGSIKRKACEMVDSAGGARLIAITYCDFKSDGEITIRSLDPKNLDKPKWTTKLPRRDGFLSIISTNPLVLAQAPGKGGPDARYDFVVLDPDSGKEKTRVPYNSFWQLGSCFLADSGCTGVLADKDSLYVSGKGVTMAYDLATGKERWTYKADANRYTIPVAVHGGRVAAYTVATPERRGRIAYLDTATGKAVRTVEHSDTAKDRKNEAMMSRIDGFPRLVDDRLLLVNDGQFADEQAGMVLAISAPW
ncbi:PQQ-binding-like beta-propeller repeat protein [Streptomyces sp. NPDC049585]|uniref:outer membrane protein assembly factor BamB family protein n=1 Tax=Streptomyces sp. NPDC049585 TaxID=3155154 RepID=UPI003443D856